MYPWLRVTSTYLRAIRRPKVDLLAMTSIRLRVWPNDLDLNRHVNNGRYLSLADLARMDWFLRTGLFAVARRHQAFPVIGDAMAKFRRDLRLFESFEIQTRMVGWDQKWAFLEHRFIRAGRIIGVVAVRGAFKGHAGTVKPQQLAAELRTGQGPPTCPAWAVTFDHAAELLSQSLREEERRAGLR